MLRGTILSQFSTRASNYTAPSNVQDLELRECTTDCELKDSVIDHKTIRCSSVSTL